MFLKYRFSFLTTNFFPFDLSCLHVSSQGRTSCGRPRWTWTLPHGAVWWWASCLPAAPWSPWALPSRAQPLPPCPPTLLQNGKASWSLQTGTPKHLFHKSCYYRGLLTSLRSCPQGFEAVFPRLMMSWLERKDSRDFTTDLHSELWGVRYRGFKMPICEATKCGCRVFVPAYPAET